MQNSFNDIMRKSLNLSSVISLTTVNKLLSSVKALGFAFLFGWSADTLDDEYGSEFSETKLISPSMLRVSSESVILK